MIYRESDDKPKLAHFVPAILLLLLTLSAAGIASVVPAKGAHEVAVLLSPRTGLSDAANIIGRAGGQLVADGEFPNLVIAFSKGPDFAAALYRAGAWLVLDPLAAHGCGGTVTTAPARP
jgi:hypothetical protein